MSNNFIWIFGENHGSTTSNNSYFFWKHIVNIKDGIDKFIIFEKNDETQNTYNNLSDYEKKFVIWKNSRKHFKKYFDADMFFVSLSYKDIIPDKFLFKDIKYKITKPVVYLRHGTAGMKSTNYEGKSYWNNMFRFLSYNPSEVEELIQKNNFQRHQILSGDFLPRYGEFVKKDQEFTNKNQILWFITWREYFELKTETKLFIKNVTNVLKSKELQDYLKKNKLKLKLCVHQFFDRERFGDIYKYSKKGIIEIVHSRDVDVMIELVKSKVLITDYSSVAYDFAFLNRPILLYQPDLDIYHKFRDFICGVGLMKEYNIELPDELIDKIINENYSVNPFFRDNWPNDIDYEYIKQNKHIDKLYEYFYKLQMNKITFIGLNFYEHDASVNYIMSMVEILLNKGYLVELISLYQDIKNFNPPYGLNMKFLYWNGPLPFKKRVSEKLLSLNSYGDLKYDSKINELHPSVGYNLKKLLKNIRSNTIISTRESIHLFVDKYDSEHVKNKIYLFNSPIDFNNKNYVDLISKIRNIPIDKSIFVSETDVNFFEKKLDFRPDNLLIQESYIIENQILKPINLNSEFLDKNYKVNEVNLNLISDNLLKMEYSLLKSLCPEKKYIYRGIYLLSLDEYYLDELNNIIDFGKYLKENNITNITIDVVGKGDYSIEFMELISNNDLFDYITFSGNNLNMINTIINHDFVLNLSNNPNYNTPYLQGVLNYKKVFCLENERTSKIFEGIPDTFIESYEWLCNQINKLHELSLKDLDEYYWTVRDKHLEKEISDKLIDYLEN